jgi:hypothetical protein
MSILNTTNTPVGISFALLDPTNSDNLSAGYPLSHEWFNEETGDKFYHKFDGVWAKYENSSIASLTEVTYSELVALVGASTLVPGRTYLLTDYETVYEQPESLETISSGIVEPLYLTAVDVNKLNKVCKSELYPEDIVYYEITGDINDEKGTEGFTKGKIYRRIDTIHNNDIGTDWRHVKYRRWAHNVNNPWTLGNNYVVGDIVNIVTYNLILICISDDNNSQSVFSDNHWFQYPALNGEYASITPSGTTHTTFISGSITIPSDPLDFQDSIMFTNLSTMNVEDFGNNSIETYHLSNNIIKSYYFYENKIGGRFEYNYIISGFYANDITYYCRENIIKEFYHNKIDIAMSRNIICDYFHNNSISGYDMYANIFVDVFRDNITASLQENYFLSFQDNTITTSFRYNKLISYWHGNTCTTGYIEHCNSINGISTASVSRNVFNSYFTYNAINGDFSNNRLTGLMDGNTFGNIFENNDIVGDNFSNNTIGSNFIGNKIGGDFDTNIVGDDFNSNTIGNEIKNWNFRSNLSNLTMLNKIDGVGRNIPYIPGTYDKTIRLSNGVLKCDYVDEHSDIIFQDDNTGPTFTFRSDLEDFRLYAENKYLPVSGIDAITPFIVDWGDAVNPLIQDIAAASSFTIIHTYSGKLTTDAVEVAVIGEYIRVFEINNYEITEFTLNSNIPQYLQLLDLENNLLTSFDTTNLPNSLQSLILGNNLLTSFDPSVALPSSLLNLYLSNNQLTSFNPSLLLPSSLQILDLSNNQLDTTEVNNTLILLNTTYTTVGSKTFTLTMSPPATPDGAGLAAKGELEAKGYTVNTD